MNMQLFWEIMFFTSPLIAGGIVALSRPVGVARYLGRFHNWLWLSSNKQVQDAGKKGFFRKYIVRPINGSLLSMARWTQGIENEFIRCGVRIASYIYSLAIFFALLAFAVYVVVSVVIIVVFTILIVWLFWFVLVPIMLGALNNKVSGSHEQENPSHKQDNSVHEQENSGATKKDMRSSHRNGNLFETKSERLMRLHNNGEQDAANSESTLLGETNRHVPFFGISESEREGNDAYKKGFDNGRKNRNK